MRVLVTRPQAKAEKTCAQLSAMGHEPVAMPLFTPVHFTDMARDMLAFNNWSALAVTSTEALAGIEAGRDAPELQHRPLFAVGPETARQARLAGFERVFTGAGNGEALAAMIAQNAQLCSDAAPLLYLAGSPRSPMLERQLKTLHIAFETATVYVMKTLDYREEQIQALAGEADAILFYSRMTATRFFALGAARLIAQRPSPPALVCLSPNVALAVPAELSGHIRIADTPHEQSMLALLP